MNWYYAEAGKQNGPLSDEQFIDLVRTGRITGETLVWQDGMTDWVPYGRLASAQSSQGSSGSINAGPSAVCAECKRMFPVEDMIRHGNSYICATCKPVFMQKLAEGASLDPTALNYAGFWIRFAAKFLDGLIMALAVGLPIMIIVFFFAFSAAHRSAANFAAGTDFPTTLSAADVAAGPFIANFIGLFAQLIMAFVNVIYSTFFIGKYGATPGKMLCGLKVVSAEGEKIGYGRAFGRSCAEILSRIICLIGYIMAAFDSQKRTLHDHICSTRVVYK